MNIMSWVVGLAIVLTIVVILTFIGSRWKKVKGLGEALVITRTNGKRDVSFTGTLVWPVINQFERMDITKKPIPVKRQGRKGGSSNGEEYEGLHCKDNIRADLNVEFYIGVNPNAEDVIKVAEHFTCEGASNVENLKRYFTPKFSEVLKTVINRFEFAELIGNRDGFKEEVKKMLAKDLDGFILYDVSIDRIDMTPLDAHDPNNVLDASGIRKITDITATQKIETAELTQNEQTQIKKKHVDGENARLQLQKTLEEQAAKTNREIEIVKTNEKNATDIAKQEARLELENARLKTDQEIQIQEENVQREVSVAQINNEKVVEIQREQVNRAKDVERVATEKQVAEKTMDKEKFIETEKSNIADIVAVRTKTERNIALEIEETENLKTKHKADRNILVSTTDATARAESDAIIKKTAAETSLEVSKKSAQEDIVKAETELTTAEKQATAKEKIAAATRVEKAAPGLAEADVRERIAVVAEQENKVEAARVLQVGNAEADVRTKNAEAIEREGRAEAVKVRELGLAQAEGTKAQYEAMGSIAPEVREHEIKKLNIEKDRDVEIASIETNATVATKNAEVMAAAMSKADIQMIGGGEMFDQIRNATSSSKALDARYNNSEVLQNLFKRYENGEGDFVADLVSVLQKSDVSTGDVGNLALAKMFTDLLGRPQAKELLAKFMSGAKQ